MTHTFRKREELVFVLGWVVIVFGHMVEHCQKTERKVVLVMHIC